MGFYKKDCFKDISLQTSIYNAIDKIFDRNIDINRGFTGVGIHRDDIVFYINKKPERELSFRLKV